MKNIISILLVLLSLKSFAGESKVAVVDMEKVYSNFYKTQALSARFEKQKAVYKAYSLTLKKQLDALKKKYDKLLEDSQNISLKESVRKEKAIGAATIRNSIKSKEDEILNYNRSKYEELQKKSEKMRNDIITEITNVVRETSVMKGYQLVIDTSVKGPGGLGPVIYFSPYIDITKIVSEKLNAK